MVIGKRQKRGSYSYSPICTRQKRVIFPVATKQETKKKVILQVDKEQQVVLTQVSDVSFDAHGVYVIVVARVAVLLFTKVVLQ